MDPRRLALCFDGTWNDFGSHTNVSDLYSAIADVHTGCPEQLKFYDPGVGTDKMERVRGGWFGYGLDRKILDGYCWLINNYQPGDPAPDDGDASREPFSRGDEIFVFGFSRGAFTARSLGGLINRVGLLRREAFGGEKIANDSPLVREAWDLYRRVNESTDETRTLDPWKAFRTKNSHNVKIRCMAVWDTVGAMGIPGHISTPFSSDNFRFHDQKLGRVVEYAYHAMAIDEHRKTFDITMWSALHPYNLEVRQRWFPGAHADVGGGYDNDLLHAPPLKWIAEQASKLDLEFLVDPARREPAKPPCSTDLPGAFHLDGSEYLSPIHDSYGDFMGGAYKWVVKPLYRRMMVPQDGVHQELDETAQQKWGADSSYRPQNMISMGRVTPDTAGPV